jgi:hypothetical protein
MALTNIPPQGKRYLVLSLVIALFAAVSIIIGAGLQTFLLVLGISVLFVIVVSALVEKFIG